MQGLRMQMRGLGVVADAGAMCGGRCRGYVWWQMQGLCVVADAGAMCGGRCRRCLEHMQGLGVDNRVVRLVQVAKEDLYCEVDTSFN